MEVRALESESSLIIYLKGILDTSNSRDLDEYLETRISAGYQKFLLDCSHLDSLSSGGISFLLRLSVKMKSNSKVVYILTQMNQEVTKLLRLFGLEHRLMIYNNLEEAKAYLARIPIHSSHTQSTQSGKLVSPSSSERKLKQASQIQFYYKGNTPPETSITSNLNSEQERTSSLVKSQKWNKEAASQESSWKRASKLSSEKVSLLEPLDENLEEKKLSQRFQMKLSPLDEKIQELKSSLSQELKQEVNEGINRILSAIPSNTNLSKNFTSSSNLTSVPVNGGNTHEGSKQESELVFCEACGTRLRVRDFGKYKCPSCSVEFTFHENGSTSFLEKLL